MKKAVFGIVKTEQEADRVIGKLQQAGFSPADISVIFADRKGRMQNINVGSTPHGEGHVSHGTVFHEKHTKAPEGAATGGFAGGVIGGTLGLLAGIGAISIPGLGPFIAAGPIMGALSGSAVGGSLGLLVGALIGLGIPEYEANVYQKSLTAGNVLLSVHVENSKQLSDVKDILEKDGAVSSICVTHEKAGTPH